MKYENLPINEVELDIDNPRIKQYVEMYKDHVSSEGIALALSAGGNSDNTSSYRALKESIKTNGGIINPIIVNRKSNGSLVVIEGNTRLQIYKEFNKNDPTGPWSHIIAMVYDNMEINHIHAIRLQAHLVGPREWDPYSKAKYLYQLSEIDHLPMTTIISYCGGKSRDVHKFIEAYKDMKESYIPQAEYMGMDPDPREFSKFAELQNGTVVHALVKKGFSKNDFAKWVLEGKIDNAQNVRRLPDILSDPIAKKEFLKSNISQAIKHLHLDEKKNKLLENISTDSLVTELVQRFQHIEYAEVRNLKSNFLYSNQKTHLFDLSEELKGLLEDIQND